MEAILRRWQVNESLLLHSESQLADKEATIELTKRCFDEDQVGSLDCRVAASRIISEQMRIACVSFFCLSLCTRALLFQEISFYIIIFKYTSSFARSKTIFESFAPQFFVDFFPITDIFSF
jgi:hypothetical protein